MNVNHRDQGKEKRKGKGKKDIMQLLNVHKRVERFV